MAQTLSDVLTTGNDAGGQAATGFTQINSGKFEGSELNIGSTIEFAGIGPTAPQTGAAQTADVTYGATEQDMLQKCYDCLRAFGLLQG